MSNELIEHAKECPTCGHLERMAVYEYTCDGCGKKLVPSAGECLLEISEHNKDTGDDRNCGIVNRHFCNWFCLFTYLPGAKYEECIGLPYIRGDMKEFLEAARAALAARPAPDAAVCPGCKREIDPEMCCCGIDRETHGTIMQDHNFVPQGCVCGYGKPAPEKPARPAGGGK